MTWIKLEDGFPDHPKILAAGPAAAWLFVAGLCYCGRFLTDGFIPAEALAKLTASPRPAVLAAKLVRVGLWEVRSGGWFVHDFTTHQRTKAQVTADREAANTRQSRRRSRRDTAVSHGEVTPPELDRELEVEKDLKPKPRRADLVAVDGAAQVPPVDLIFGEWQKVTGHPRAVLDANRRGFILKAIRTHGVDTTIAAVRGWQHSPHHTGDNDRGQVYDGLDVILRNAQRIEQFAGYELEPSTRPDSTRRSTKPTREQRADDVLESFVQGSQKELA